MKRLLALAVAFATLATPLSQAFSLDAGYVDREASGNGSYEAMAIHPEAVYDEEAGKTYIAYQGFGLDPYVAAYDHGDEAWEGPFRVGENPLVQDFHGGPSLVVDEEGYVHVFYGAHNSPIRHAKSSSPGDVSAWGAPVLVRPVVGGNVQATYPQPLLVDGEIVLFYRVRDLSDLDGRIDDGAWAYVTSRTGEYRTWTEPRIVIGVRNYDDGTTLKSRDSWYANFSVSDDGRRVDCAFHWRDYSSTDMFTRYDLYYMRYEADRGEWYGLNGEALPEDPKKDYPGGEPGLDDRCKVWDSGVYGVNQQVVSADPTGNPGILFVAEAQDGPDEFEWRYAQGELRSIPGTESMEVTFTAPPVRITGTDDFFDAGELAFEGSTPIAYLTTGGVPDPQAVPEDSTPARGGDITRWTRSDGDWEYDRAIRQSANPAERYNDPQLVRTSSGGPPHPDARLMFSEWDNDGANFIHKVYLWGGAGTGAFLGREFTPEVERLQGPTRVETAVEISKRGFPNGSQTYIKDGSGRTQKAAVAFVASKADFPDVLCGAPLAQAYGAPLLLVSPDKLDAAVSAEVDRLFDRTGSPESKPKIKQVFVLGSEAAVSKAVADALDAKTGVTVKRIAGSDRYETAKEIAKALRERRGGVSPGKVVVASGLAFPDALVVSPLAARNAWPILLARPDSLPKHTVDAIGSLRPTGALVVGSEAAVGPDAYAQVAALTDEAPDRRGGATRYDTALAIARYAQQTGVLTAERFVLASGENFPDGLAGGVLAARFRASMLITSKDLRPLTATLPQATEAFVTDNKDEILDVFVLGGPPAISPEVETRLMGFLLPFDEAPE